jgi:ABC-type phosphate/phosphonate transport system substrate-binding protein
MCVARAGPVHACGLLSLSYCSHLVVRADDTRSVADLRGATVAVNDAQSLSGYHVLKAWLAWCPPGKASAGADDTSPFFGTLLRSVRAVKHVRAEAPPALPVKL